MANYVYLAADLRSGAILNELPLVDVSFGGQLNGAGDLRARIPIIAASDALGVSELLRASDPARTALFVDRDGVLVWGGVIWTRRTSSGAARSLEIGGLETWSYFRHRRLTSDYTGVAVDQAAIVKALLDHAQAKPGGDIRVAVPTVTTGKLRDRTWYSYERKNIGEAVEQLAGVLDGFDFAIDVAYVADVPTSTFRIGYPRRGRTVGATGLMWELPGNVIDYSLAEDGTAVANSVSGLGQGDGVTKLVVTQTDTTRIDAGYPLLEDTVSLGDVKTEATLDAHVIGEVARRAPTPQAMTLTVDPTQDPVFGSWITGDDCRVRITDQRFPDTLDTFMRIVSWTLTPGGGDTPELLVLTLAPATSMASGTFTPPTDATQTAAVERRLAALETAPQADLTAVRDGAFVVVDSSGRVVVRMGKLRDGSYGIEQVDPTDAAKTVSLSAVALGTQANTTFGPVSVTSATATGATVTVAVPSTGRVSIHISVNAFMDAGVTLAQMYVLVDGAGGPFYALAEGSNPTAAQKIETLSATQVITGLSPGTHTFQLGYATTLGLVDFYSSTIVVRPY